MNAITAAQTLSFRQWLIGVLNAVISGAAVVLSGLVVGVSWRNIGIMALFSAAISLGKYLQQHPIPGGVPD